MRKLRFMTESSNWWPVVGLSLCVLLSACAGPSGPPRSIESHAERYRPGDMRTDISPETPPASYESPAEVRPTKVVKVALLLPLSGNASELGQSMLDAAILALNDKFSNLPKDQRTYTRVILIPKDTRGDVTTSVAVAQNAVREGADIIVGPVFSNNLAAVTEYLRGQDTPVIAFSNNQAAAAPGVYLMGFLPEQQIRRVVEYASQRGASKFATLLPNDAYGQAVHQALTKVAAEEPVELVNAIYYPPGAYSLKTEAGQLFGRRSQPELEDGQEADKQFQLKYGFEALLVPEGGQRLHTLVEAMKQKQVDDREFIVLGSGQWDESSESLPPSLQGSWFASADPDRRRRFDRHFTSTYGYQPVRLASIAYDATALVTTLAYSGVAEGKQSGRSYFSGDVLTDPSGFNGPVDGIFRFHPDGRVERGLAVLEVSGNGFKVVDPAPKAFAN